MRTVRGPGGGDVKLSDDLFARPEPVDPTNPNSKMNIGFYIKGTKVPIADFMKALQDRNASGMLNEYVRSGARYAPKFNKQKGVFEYSGSLGDPRLMKFYEMQGQVSQP